MKETPGWALKKCRDFGRIRNWAEKWRAFDGEDTESEKGDCRSGGSEGKNHSLLGAGSFFFTTMSSKFLIVLAANYR